MPAPRTHRSNTYTAHNRANLAAVVLVLALVALMGWVVYGAVASVADAIAPCTDVVTGCPR